MELTAVITGVVLAVGVFVVLAGLMLPILVASHQDLLNAILRRAGELARWFGRRVGRQPGHRVHRTGPGEKVLVLSLTVGLTAVAAAAVGMGKLIDNVTDGDGLAVLDHPVGRFVAARREPVLTSVMNVVSMVGGPAGMTTMALAAGLLPGIAWRSWAPVTVLAVTVAGVIGLTIVFKVALGRSRPPLAQSVAPADGFGFPSGHAAVPAAAGSSAAMRSAQASIAGQFRWSP